MGSRKLSSIAVMLCILLALALPALVLGREKCSRLSYEALSIYISTTGESKVMSLEEYTAHVCAPLAVEGYSVQTLKALAIVARTRALLYSYTACKGDYCTCPEHSLQYSEEVPQEIADAVNSTSGQILVYEGALVPAFVHKSSYLATASAYDLIGREIGCLVSVSSPESVEEKSVFVPRDEFELTMQIKLGLEGFSYDDEISADYGSTGRINRVITKEGSVSGEAFALAMGAESTNITLEKSDEGCLVSYRGCGDGLGLSIEGAEEMAKRGSTADEILSHYYQGSRLSPVYTVVK